MKAKNVLSLILVGLVSACASVAPADEQTQEKPTVKIREPGVPEIMTMEGKFVRAAYNNEGYVILGYQLANRTLGEKYRPCPLLVNYLRAGRLGRKSGRGVFEYGEG